jgi:hypothetical protein
MAQDSLSTGSLPHLLPAVVPEGEGMVFYNKNVTGVKEIEKRGQYPFTVSCFMFFLAVAKKD